MKILLIFFIFLKMSCGTEVGNPLTDFLGGDDGESDTPSQDSNAGMVSFSSQLKTGVCEKLVECYSSTITQSNCENNIDEVDGFDTELGLNSSDYSKFSEIQTDEESDSISANSTYSSQCISDIDDLICSDSEVINAYNSSSPNDYSSTFEVIPTGSGSCNDVF